MTQDTLRLDNQVCFAMYSASNAVVRLYRPLLDEFELTYPQYLVLMSLWERDGVAQRQLCQQTLLDPGTMTPIVKRLENKGLLERRPDPDDERAKQVVLTDRGRALESQLAERLKTMYQEVALSREELAEAKAVCELVRERVLKR